MTYEDDTVAWRTFHIRKSLCIPIKYTGIIVSFTLKIPMFFIVKLLRFDLKWNEACDIHHNRKYYISYCGNKSFNFQWVSYKHHWKITTLCVQHHAWLSIFDNALSKVFLQVSHSRIHQTWLYLIIVWLGLFIFYYSKIDYKWMFYIFYCHQINYLGNQWFPKKATGMFSP